MRDDLSRAAQCALRRSHGIRDAPAESARRVASCASPLRSIRSCFAVLLIKSLRLPRRRGRLGFLARWPAQGPWAVKSGGDDDTAELDGHVVVGPLDLRGVPPRSRPVTGHVVGCVPVQRVVTDVGRLSRCALEVVLGIFLVPQATMSSQGPRKPPESSNGDRLAWSSCQVWWRWVGESPSVGAVRARA
jgi:hypothetical protein